ncbi:glycosyltransferase [Staphylococcus saprophyticus]|jgi:glycosyltransferase involved in cell wall biosynthesis|uniref:Putative glucosyl transferase n=1 Tax=Staphylococcus saprophyticus subsp. saprophyticus (strain ATCC 15305 / DSM 20229 / NCIMB 8711 / NCTC 7292 / S-41) TaxID=342451 RepID=Q49VQ2_STAS1|nr:MULTISPECIES: glycosyltransferase family 2 protein [Staphylococcus]CRV25010.1 stress response protein [Streptococcus equi subsp. equi]AMG18742.1 glycosyltransferase [Staphylococcus saprophyticus]AMG34132.1 glycosyltransferase [Staphylococcus saprophyticus]ASE57765.1 glycosyltransferase [Staphylococcus saprophyticus]ASF18796.1 glycosyltransferase [Staphylococcus saprophyticus]
MQMRVIVPCYNEGEVILKTYEKLTEILSKDSQYHHYDYDILFVDDGSKDKTINYIQDMATKDHHVKFISFSRNFGKESAMIAGYQHSKDCDGVIMIDADLQHPPELIPQMIEGYMDGYDQVIAKRDRIGEKQSRKVMTKIYYKLINHFVEDIKLEDGIGDFRLLSQRAVISLTQLDEYNRFSKGLYEWIGYNTKVFTYENVEREDGESKWSFSKLLNYGIDGLISFNNKPLRAMIYLGLIVFFISLLYIGYISVGIMIRGVETPGYFSTIAAILLLGGIQLISIGIVGEYIGRIYYEVKQRPKYIVQATNFNYACDNNKQNINQDINHEIERNDRQHEMSEKSKSEKELIKNR